ncbi:methyltransferase domain-containing protein [Sulfurimonas aquatica]|uniref:Methyltransferase domain-containing protein n=1 Tax=Sulfurimonas aquatica TaxID=2672570 RepID=A0A975B0F4_9BACT|nr:methyltransferase domain-containing protein [Sulfurimonas aquatica]QSZ41823.1 methyltransferase domain-containing protein [Sulfurimonas aquatica]
MQEHNKASAWFDDLYKRHENDHNNIPWARQDVNPLLQTYLDEEKEHKGKALVIGCGLGDDAYALDKAGYEVVAIDVSQTALNLAKKRFSDSNILFEKQDIFDMPEMYYENFDFVFEALTIQSLPVAFREKMINAVVDTVAKDGNLLIVAHQHRGNNDGPPWPLTHDDISLFLTHGMQELSFELINEASGISNTKFRVLYKKV